MRGIASLVLHRIEQPVGFGFEHLIEGLFHRASDYLSKVVLDGGFVVMNDFPGVHVERESLSVILLWLNFTFAASIDTTTGHGTFFSKKSENILRYHHLNLCMMATSVTCKYAMQLDKTLKRRHAVKDRSHFAFLNVRKDISEAVMSKGFRLFAPMRINPL